MIFEGIFILSFLSALWHFPTLLLLLTRFRLYKTNDVISIQNKVKYSSVYENDKPVGLFIGRWYIGFITEGESNNKEKSKSGWILTTPDTYKELTKTDCKDKKTLNIWEIEGNFFWYDYCKRKIGVDNFISRDLQKNVISKICKIYREKHSCVSYIFGKPGSGKSSLAILIAKELNGSLCKHWKPYHAGRSLSKLHRSVNPTIDCPLIILLDEIDILFDKFGKIMEHKHMPTEVTDKVSWNSMLDDINIGLYPNIILILTSNISWTNYDQSYTRNGRVDMRYIMD